jgi:hypothetical protein
MTTIAVDTTCDAGVDTAACPRSFPQMTMPRRTSSEIPSNRFEFPAPKRSLQWINIPSPPHLWRSLSMTQFDCGATSTGVASPTIEYRALDLTDRLCMWKRTGSPLVRLELRQTQLRTSMLLNLQTRILLENELPLRITWRIEGTKLVRILHH